MHKKMSVKNHKGYFFINLEYCLKIISSDWQCQKVPVSINYR